MQNWYPGDREGRGGIYNFVTKKRQCLGVNSEDHMDAGRDRIRDHAQQPGCILMGDNSVGEFYSVATNNWQQADTGTKMIHLGKNTRSTIVSKGISAGHGL